MNESEMVLKPYPSYIVVIHPHNLDYCTMYMKRRRIVRWLNFPTINYKLFLQKRVIGFLLVGKSMGNRLPYCCCCQR